MATADDTQPDSPSLFGWSLPREGVYWLGAVGMLTLAGWLKSINLVLLLAYFLFGLWLLNVLIVGTAFRRARARRHWAGPVWAGRTAVCEVVLGNAGRWAVPFFQVAEAGPGIGAGGAVDTLARGQETTLRREVCLAHRGRVLLPALTASCRAPLGLVERRVRLVEAEELVVLPRRGALHGDRLRRWLTYATRGDGRPHRLTRPSVLRDTDLYGLRPFRPGDSPRHIHWRTTARRGELMIREFADAQPRCLLLVVAPEVGSDTDATKRLDALVSLASTVAWEWCRQAGDELWVAVGGPAPQLWPRLVARDQSLPAQAALAVLDQQAGDPDKLLDLAAEVPEEAALMVVGSPAVANRLEERLRRPVARLDPTQCYDFYEPPQARRFREWEKLARR